MAGLRPGHPRLSCLDAAKTWMPGIADKFTQSAQGRLLWPGMTNSTRPDGLGGPRFRCLANNLRLRPARDTRRVSLHPNIVLAARSGVAEDRARIPMLIDRSQSPFRSEGGRAAILHARRQLESGGSGWPSTWLARSTTMTMAIARWSCAEMRK